MQDPLGLFKADISSAFRRIPLKPEHSEFAYVAFRSHEGVSFWQHHAMPFGAVSSVHHWDRVGSLLCALARRILKIPLCRYVDDFFSGERAECIEQAKDAFARMVRCLLGTSAIAPQKLLHGNPLSVFGVGVLLHREGASFWPGVPLVSLLRGHLKDSIAVPDPDKIKKWRLRIDAALASGQLLSGDASKLAGSLQWGTQFIFRRLGRAMIRPIFAHITARSPAVDTKLQLSLRWWSDVLSVSIREKRHWIGSARRPVHLYCDARSTPPRIAAVLFWFALSCQLTWVCRRCCCGHRDGNACYCDMEPSATVLTSFTRRSDNQIMALELLSIALGGAVLPCCSFRL